MQILSTWLSSTLRGSGSNFQFFSTVPSSHVDQRLPFSGSFEYNSRVLVAPFKQLFYFLNRHSGVGSRLWLDGAFSRCSQFCWGSEPKVWNLSSDLLVCFCGVKFSCFFIELFFSFFWGLKMMCRFWFHFNFLESPISSIWFAVKNGGFMCLAHLLNSVSWSFIFSYSDWSLCLLTSN